MQRGAWRTGGGYAHLKNGPSSERPCTDCGSFNHWKGDPNCPNPGGGNPPFHNAWRVNGDRVPVSPLFPMGYGLSYTAFGFADATIDAAGIPAEGLNGTALAKTMLKVRVAVSNTGERAGATPIIVTFSK